MRLVAKLTGERAEQEDDVVRELLESGRIEEEMRRRGKYDGKKAFRRMMGRRRKSFVLRVSAVACGLLILGGISWFFWMNQPTGKEETEVVYGVHGNQQVVLQLSGGERVTLGEKDSLLLREKDKAIEVSGGVIAYHQNKVRAGGQEGLYNTLFVPRGGEFRVKLSDGTVVHLNADSELRYPVAFSERERGVYLKGEAWFEVAKDQKRPFYVTADDVRVRVYGTSFNVNTHGAKVIQTVLVEGVIGIRSSGDNAPEVRVQPGQLAEYSRTDGEIRLKEVDVRQYTAWKEGIFYFDDKTLEDILGELSRWYDVEFEYGSDKAKELHFSGYLKRYDDVRKILATVTESTGVKFVVKGKTIVVN